MLIYTESLFKYSSVNPDRQQYAYRDNPLYIYIFKKSALLWLQGIINLTILRTMDDYQCLIGIKGLIPTIKLHR